MKKFMSKLSLSKISPLKRFVISLLLSLALLYLSLAPVFNLPTFAGYSLDWLLALLQLLLGAVNVYLGTEIFLNGIRAFAKLKPTMHSLAAVGTAFGGLFSVYSVVAVWFGKVEAVKQLCFTPISVIITFALLSEYVNLRLKPTESKAQQSLLSLIPAHCNILVEDDLVPVETTEITSGERVAVASGESFPCDGVVLFGNTRVNESAFSGEPTPVLKTIGQGVLAGTQNLGESVVIEALKTGEETALARIAKTTAFALASKPVQKSVSAKFESLFVWSAVGFSFVMFLIWLLATGNFVLSANIFVAVVLFSFPCSFAVSEPLALFSAQERGAKEGILFKNIFAVSTAKEIKTAVFNNSGTVTVGTPFVTNILPFGTAEEDVLQLTATLFSKLKNPISRAICEHAYNNDIELFEFADYASIENSRVSAEINGDTITVGTIENLFAGEYQGYIAPTQGFALEGKTLIAVSKNGVPIGVIALADKLKPTSKSAISQLNNYGVKTILVSGASAQNTAKQLEFYDFAENMSPLDKSGLVTNLRMSKKQVAMVGSGTSDTAAIASADLGVALGSASEPAHEAAQVILVRNDLRDVEKAIKLSKLAFATTKVNLWLSVGFNLLSVPFSAGIIRAFGGAMLPPSFVAFATVLSTVSILVSTAVLKKRKIK